MDDFDAFVRAHERRLHAAVARVARRYGQEPDDALQEALLRAYTHRATFESEQHAVNWVVRVARDLLCDQRRSWYGQRVTVSAELCDTALGSAPDPADVVVGRDDGRAVLRAVRSLPHAHRLLLWQHAVEGRSYADIARESARPLATVRSVALRARARARQQLRPADGTFGLLAGLRVRLRTWRAHAGCVTTEPVAAALALALTWAWGAAAVAQAAPPGITAEAHARVTSSPAVATARPAHHPSARPAAPPATTAARPSRSPLPVGGGATSGSRSGACAFSGEPAAPRSAPLIALADAGRYECRVEATSTTCTIVPDDPTAAAVGCSWSLRGVFEGGAKGVNAPARLCDPEAGAGTFVLALDGAGTHEVPAQLFLNDDGILANGSLDLPGRTVSVSLHVPYLCTEADVALLPATGQIRVASR